MSEINFVSYVVQQQNPGDKKQLLPEARQKLKQYMTLEYRFYDFLVQRLKRQFEELNQPSLNN